MARAEHRIEPRPRPSSLMADCSDSIWRGQRASCFAIARVFLRERRIGRTQVIHFGRRAEPEAKPYKNGEGEHRDERERKGPQTNGEPAHRAGLAVCKHNRVAFRHQIRIRSMSAGAAFAIGGSAYEGLPAEARHRTAERRLVQTKRPEDFNTGYRGKGTLEVMVGEHQAKTR